MATENIYGYTGNLKLPSQSIVESPQVQQTNNFGYTGKLKLPGVSSMEEPSTLDKFKYGVAQETMLLGDLYRLSIAGINAIGPTTFEQEREKIEEARRQKILEQFPWAKGGQYDNDSAVWGGRTATMLADPVYLLMPWGRAAQAGKLIGKGGAALAGLGAGVGATDVSVREFARTGEVTPTNIAIGAGAGAVLSPAAMGVQKIAGAGLNKIFPNLFKSENTRKAINETLDNSFQNKYNLNASQLANVKNISQNKSVVSAHQKIAENDSLYQNFILPQQRLLDAIKNISTDLSKGFGQPLTKQMVKEIVSEIPNGANIKFKALGNKTIVTASKAQLNKASNEVKKEIRSNISKFLKDEARANSNLQIEIVKQMHKNGGLTSAVARALAVNFTKPALGAGGGAVFGTLFTDSDEGFYNFVAGGAAVGLTHRVLMRGGIKGIPKPQQLGFAKILKGEYWTNLDRKLRILTSTTQQSKLTARGPVTDEFSNTLFARPYDTVRLDWLGRVPKNADESIGLIGSGNSIEELADRRFAQFVRQAYEDVVGGSDSNLQIQALNIVRGDKASKYSQEAQDLAGRVKGYLDEFKEYYRGVGFKEKEILDNYFPRKFDFKKIMSSDEETEKFMDTVTTVFQNMTKNASKDNPIVIGYKKDGSPKFIKTKLSKAKAREAANTYFDSIKQAYDNPIVDYASKTTKGGAVAGQLNTYNMQLPISDHIKFQRILKGSFDDVEKLLTPYLVNDIGDVLADLARTSVKSVEFARRFGTDGKGLRTFLDRLRTQYKDEGFVETKGYFSPDHKADVDAIKNAINSYFGRYGKQGGPTARHIGAVLSTLANFNMMDKVTIANLGDLIQPFQNSRFFLSALQGMGQNVSKQMAVKHTQIAQAANRNAYFTADGASSPFTLSNRQPGNFMSILGKSNDAFFKLIGLEALTNLARRYAYNVGAVDSHKTAQRFVSKFKGRTLNVNNIKDNSLLADVNHLIKTGVISVDNNNNVRNLSDVIAFGRAKNLDAAMNTQSSRTIIDRVGNKAANRDAIIPQVGNRLLFTQHRDPMIRMLGQFSSWAMAKSAQTNAMIGRIENAELRTAIGMLGALAIFGGVQDIRDFVKTGELKTIQELEKEPDKWLAFAGNMSGNLGWLPTTVVNQLAGYGSSRPVEFFPAMSIASNIADGFAGTVGGILNKEPYDRAVRNFYEVLPAPTVRAILDRAGVPFTVYKKGYNVDRVIRENPFRIKTLNNLFSKGGAVSQARKLFNKGDVVQQTVEPSNYQYDLKVEPDRDVYDKEELNTLINEGPKIVPKKKPVLNTVSANQVYNYLINEKGLDKNKSLGILANIYAESNFKMDAEEVGGGGGIGLFQHTYSTRKKGLLETVPDYKTNWKGQIDYALSENEAKGYLNTDFKTAEDAAQYFMVNNLRPAEFIERNGEKINLREERTNKHNEYLKSFKEKLNFNIGGLARAVGTTIQRGLTQVTNTAKSYEKVNKIFDDFNVLTVHDFGSGLGVGSKKFTNKKVTSHEPFADLKKIEKVKGRKPDYIDVKDMIMGEGVKSKDGVINHMVLNVIEDKAERDIVVKQIANLLNDKGIGVITTRTAQDVASASTKKPYLDGFLIKKGKEFTFQKGFSQSELRNYISEVLGDLFDVLDVPKKYNLGGSGVIITRKDKLNFRYGGYAAMRRAMTSNRAYSGSSGSTNRERYIASSNQSKPKTIVSSGGSTNRERYIASQSGGGGNNRGNQSNTNTSSSSTTTTTTTNTGPVDSGGGSSTEEKTKDKVKRLLKKTKNKIERFTTENADILPGGETYEKAVDIAYGGLKFGKNFEIGENADASIYGKTGGVLIGDTVTRIDTSVPGYPQFKTYPTEVPDIKTSNILDDSSVGAAASVDTKYGFFTGGVDTKEGVTLGYDVSGGTKFFEPSILGQTMTVGVTPYAEATFKPMDKADNFDAQIGATVTTPIGSADVFLTDEGEFGIGKSFRYKTGGLLDKKRG
jgi:hypothetical protein